MQSSFYFRYISLKFVLKIHKHALNNSIKNSFTKFYLHKVLIELNKMLIDEEATIENQSSRKKHTVNKKKNIVF